MTMGELKKIINGYADDVECKFELIDPECNEQLENRVEKEGFPLFVEREDSNPTDIILAEVMTDYDDDVQLVSLHIVDADECDREA